MSDSAVSKPIFEVKVTEDKNSIAIPMLSGSDKAVLSFGSMAARASSKISGGGFADYSSTIGSGGFKFLSSTGGSEFETFPKIKTEYSSGE